MSSQREETGEIQIKPESFKVSYSRKGLELGCREGEIKGICYICGEQLHIVCQQQNIE